MTGMNKPYDSFACVAPSPNTGYTAHFVRQNRLTPTSYSPRPLDEIAGDIGLEERGINKKIDKGTTRG